ncbi:hypothetical protein FGG08_004423 [Glutinoglossum americanum]|uniref:Uncharacterized protein n=1 Tax=Glutinoglossum americanum TaxID=1670608 RepID=A0A9P8I2F1_9PEZI|nr:hypothetical protein FGG08_004423 [Glutinoglossum americanum]
MPKRGRCSSTSAVSTTEESTDTKGASCMEFQSLSGGAERRPELSSVRPDLASLLGEYIWIYGNVGCDGIFTLRFPGGSDNGPEKATGEVTFGESACNAWATITKLTPCVDGEGNEYWGIEVDEWIYENGDIDDSKPGLRGHQLAVTVVQDDDGHPYIVFTMYNGSGEGGDPYSFMIGKRSWSNRTLTKGDVERLGLPRGSNFRFPSQETSRKHELKDIQDERVELGLEHMELLETRLDIPALLGTYRWVYNSEEQYPSHPWCPHDAWDEGLTLARSPAGHKITGSLSLQASGAKSTTTVAGLSQTTSEDDKEVWGLTARAWHHPVPRPHISDHGSFQLDGNLLAFTVEKDDHRNPFLVLMLNRGQTLHHWSRRYTPCYAYLIGKKQRSRFGRLGFGVEEFVRLVHGSRAGIVADDRGQLMQRAQGYYQRVWNPLAQERAPTGPGVAGGVRREIFWERRRGEEGADVESVPEEGGEKITEEDPAERG